MDDARAKLPTTGEDQSGGVTPLRAYAFAVGAVALCALVRSLLNPLLEHEGIYLAFMIPVAAAGYVGGMGPGILSAILSALIASPYVRELPVPNAAASITHLALFSIEAGAVVWLMERLRQSRIRAERAMLDAQAARRLAEEATEAREQFMARVSHEWRGPLTAIAGWLSQMEIRSADSAFVLRATVSMKGAVESQTRFLADLLDYSRGRQGKLSLQPQRIAIGEPLQRAIETSTPAAVARGLAIHLAEDDGDARVWGDAVRLQQVFTNLVQNATKFTPPGGEITVRTAMVDRAVEVSVTDTGIGIPPEALRAIFEPFRQADGERDSRRGGLGLGLSIAREIVELHGGSLHAWSGGVGCGATFTVRLPLAVAEDVRGGAAPLRG